MRPKFRGADIIAGRSQAGISQSELALMLGVTQTTISRWEMGAQAPSASMQRKVMLFLEQTKSERLIEQIVEHSPFMMALMKRTWTIVAVSPCLAGLDGRQPAELRGFSLQEIATAEMEQSTNILSERGFFNGACGPQRIVARGVLPDGRPRAFDAVAIPVPLDGEIVMLNQVCLLSDEDYVSLRQKMDLVTALN